MFIRKSWDDYFMDIAKMVATRSTCLRRQIGAIAVKDKRILVTGYNGAPSNSKHCLDLGCIRDERSIPSGTQAQICRAIHAEQNLLAQAALQGVCLKGASIYVANQPCLICMKMLTGIQPDKLVYEEQYPDKDSIELLKQLARTDKTNNTKYVKWLFYNWQ